MIAASRISGTRRKEANLARRRYQKGSLVLAGTVWKARWREDVISEDGTLRRIRRQITFERAQFPTKKLAQRQFDLTLARVNALDYAARKVATFDQFAERWKMELLPQREVSGQRAAKWHLRRYLIPALGTRQLHEIGTEQAQMLISSMVSAGKSGKTANNVVGTLSSILKTARSWGYSAHEINWKALVFPKRGKPRRRFFTDQQVRDIIGLAEKKWPDECWALLFTLAAKTGLREGEILGLQWQDIDLQVGALLVQRKVWYGHVGAPKTVTSERGVPLPVSLVQRLRRYKETWVPNAQGWLFATATGRPVMPQHVTQRKLWKLLDELKIKRCGLHAFRHGHASMLVDDGAPMTVVRDQLGHTDVRLTLDVYSHVIGQAQRAAIEKLSARLDADGRAEERESIYIN